MVSPTPLLEKNDNQMSKTKFFLGVDCGGANGAGVYAKVTTVLDWVYGIVGSCAPSNGDGGYTY